MFREGQKLVKVSALFCLWRSYTQSNKMKTFAPLFLLTGVKYYLFCTYALDLSQKKFQKDLEISKKCRTFAAVILKTIFSP